MRLVREIVNDIYYIILVKYWKYTEMRSGILFVCINYKFDIW